MANTGVQVPAALLALMVQGRAVSTGKVTFTVTFQDGVATVSSLSGRVKGRQLLGEATLAQAADIVTALEAQSFGAPASIGGIPVQK